METFDYSYLMQTPSAKQWARIGTARRSGVIVPLFSVYSKSSVGIGELTDLKWLIEWCRKNSMSLIQLLPINDAGGDFAPYNAESSFALDPMYLNLNQVVGVSHFHFRRKIKNLKRQFPTGKSAVDYGIKQAKLDLLWEMFQRLEALPDAFQDFTNIHRCWLDNYALFKTIKEKNNCCGWEDWEEGLKTKEPQAIQKFVRENSQRIEFHRWLQWQLFLQMKEMKQLAQAHHVFLKGDLPFLVSRDSADVWGNPHYFKLDRSAGAPPDLYFALGQRWGMPVYNWGRIEEDHFQYIQDRLQYAQNFFDLFRIDHVVGFFRVWSIDLKEPLQNHGLNGTFDPENEAVWGEHGRKLLKMILAQTEMLPCGEDLGTIPQCCVDVLEELGILGMDVQRWKKEWQRSYDFILPPLFRKTSVATLSTHDMCSFMGWWQEEADTIDQALFDHALKSQGIEPAQVHPLLFDLAASKHQRLRWKKEIDSKEKLLHLLGLSPEQAWQIIDLYLGSTHEKERFLSFLGWQEKEPPTLEAICERTIQAAAQSASLFFVLLLQDWLALTEEPLYKKWEFRINFPGTVGRHNWSLVYPTPLEDLIKLKENKKISLLNKSAKRI